MIETTKKNKFCGVILRSHYRDFKARVESRSIYGKKVKISLLSDCSKIAEVADVAIN